MLSCLGHGENIEFVKKVNFVKVITSSRKWNNKVALYYLLNLSPIGLNGLDRVQSFKKFQVPRP